MKKTLTILALLTVLLAGCTEKLPSSDVLTSTAQQDEISSNEGDRVPDGITSIRDLEKMTDGTGYYETLFLPGIKVFTYTDFETATEEIVKINGEPMIYDLYNSELENPSRIYPIANTDTILLSYEIGESRIDAVNRTNGKTVTLYTADDAIFWVVAYDAESIYISEYPYEEKVQRIVRVDYDGNSQIIAELSIDVPSGGQDITAYMIYSYDNVFYAGISTADEYLIKRINEDGSTTELSTLPGFAEARFVDFYEGYFYQLITDSTMSRLSLTDGSVEDLGKIDIGHEVRYLHPVGEGLYYSMLYLEEEQKYFILDIATLLADEITLGYEYSYPLQHVESVFTEVVVNLNGQLAVVTDVEQSSRLYYNPYSEIDELSVHMFEKTALISLEDYRANNPAYTEINREEVSALLNFNDDN